MAPIEGHGIVPGLPAPKGHALVRFRKNTTYNGTDYGPSFPQRVTVVESSWARRFVRQGRAEYVTADPPEVDATPAGPELEEVPSAPERVTPTEPGAIPDDFPGARALASAGVTSLDELRGVEDLTAIRGIGAATADAIREALAAGG